jgi:hypothetical protein
VIIAMDVAALYGLCAYGSRANLEAANITAWLTAAGDLGCLPGTAGSRVSGIPVCELPTGQAHRLSFRCKPGESLVALGAQHRGG